MYTADIGPADGRMGVEVGLVNPAECDKVRDRVDTPRQWTIKGLDPVTVEVSREAAKRSGMKLNAWVSRALEQAATGTVELPHAAPARDASVPSGDTLAGIREELSRLKAQNEDMRKTVQTMSGILLKLCADRI